MAVDLKGRSLLTLKDWTPEEVRHVLDLSRRVKKDRRNGKRQERFKGMTLALLFEKRSTRTRCAFETAFGEEGGHPVFLSTADIHLGTKEAVEDTARVFGRMFDAIQFRGFSQATVETLAKWAGVPVYNGLTDEWHPTQVLADLMTLEEAIGSLAGKKARLCGRWEEQRRPYPAGRLRPDGRAHHDRRPSVPGARPPRTWSGRGQWARGHGAQVLVTSDVETGVKGADAVYTDVWISMGEEEKSAERIALLSPYQVNDAMMEKTGQPGRHFPALPARCEGQGSHNRSDRGAEVPCLGRSGKPQAYDQSDDAGDALVRAPHHPAFSNSLEMACETTII